MTHSWPAADGRPLDLDYFVHWRTWLWRAPVEAALRFVGYLKGKRLLEIGGGPGRMTAMFALLGAHVTMVESAGMERAQAEVRKWDLAERVELIATTGSFAPLAGRQFDVIFTKSVLWGIEKLAEFLDDVEKLLAPGGKVAFVENCRGGASIQWLRRTVVHRGQFHYEGMYFGIRPDQFPLFQQRFADVQIRRRRVFVYTLFGTKKAPDAP
jgi:2-polyprenyl-3-methyl-5-hydroxy-6-metoxy-1,4-benzoquinol methylase